MIILGLDPGLARTGYAFLSVKNRDVRLLACGCISTQPGESEARRLLEIRQDLAKLIQKWKPDAACLESLFFAANAKTAMKVGQARGVCLALIAEKHLPAVELTPLQVKIAATGYGKADKNQVQRMIVKLLNLKKIPKPDDAVDAAAVAWAGIGRIKLLQK